MGRHSAPQTGEPTFPRRAAVAVGAAVLALAVGVSVVGALVGGNDDQPVTAREATGTSPPPGSGTGPATTTASATGSASAASTPASSSPPASARPATLDLRLTGTSFVTVRLASGRTLVSRLMHKGDHKSYDQKELHVVLGNAAAVQVTVNGHRLKPGRSGQVRTLVATRR